MSGKAIRETLAALGVIASMVFVGIEIRQNTLLVEAQLESDEHSAWVTVDGSKQSEQFAATLAKSIERPEDLTLAEMVELDGYLYTYLDLLWRRSVLSDLGLGHDLNTEAWDTAQDYFGNEFARAWWEETDFKHSPELIESVERAMAEVSPTQDLDFYARIASRLSSDD